MTQVITFSDYRPIPRYDSLPWTKVRIEEGTSATGSWVQIDELALSPLDTDPANPAARNFTTALASSTPLLWYRVIFVDAATDAEAPTDPIQNGATGTLYVTRDELKEILDQQNETFQDEAIDVAIEAASRACDGYKHTRFYPTTETRIYTPNYWDDFLRIDELNALTGLKVDVDGDGTYETAWTEGTDFILGPVNNQLESRPFSKVMILEQSNRRFPNFRNSVQIQGSFGWVACPALVKEATIILANHLLFRMKQAPLGVLVAAANDMVTTARVGRIDTAAQSLLDAVNPTAASSQTVQLA